jgi:hypothetical protein
MSETAGDTSAGDCHDWRNPDQARNECTTDLPALFNSLIEWASQHMLQVPQGAAVDEGGPTSGEVGPPS